MIKARFRLYFILIDFLAAIAGWLGFYTLRKQVLGHSVGGNLFSLGYSAFTVAILWVLLYAFCGFYVDVLRKSRAKELFTLLRINLFGVLLLLLAIVLEDVYLSSGNVGNYASLASNIITYFVIHFLCSSVAKMSIMTYSKTLIKSGKVYFNTLVVGSEAAAVEIYDEVLKQNYHVGLKFCGYVHVSDNGKHHLMVDSIPHLGYIDQTEAIIKKQGIEQVIIAVEPTEHKKIEYILNQVEGTGVIVSIIPDIYQILLGSVKVAHIFGTPLIEIRQSLMPIWQQYTKRAIDIIVSILVMVLGFPGYVLVAFLTRLSSPGPIFYKQERIGKGGLPFNIYKYRSMFTNAEQAGPKLSSTHDPRITKWGLFMRKTRLDEFPQFYNVLRGDMSLVGPRPERQFFIDQIVLKAPHYKHLNRVRPGITSLGQVKYGYAENVDEMVRRLKYDILYIENMSLAMDFRIIIYTIITIFKGSGK